MTRLTHRSLQGLLLTFLITVCSNSSTSENNTLNQRYPSGTVAMSSEDPCAIVLVPHAMSEAESINRIDASIVRYQQAVLRASRPLPQLEHLGWAFVAKARASRDAGYYTLAKQAAACIDSKSPDSAESLLLQGHVLHNLHRFKEAEALARRLVEQRGLWFDFALLGDVLMERGALEEAIDAYQTVVDQRPGPQAYVRIAQLRWLRGDLDGAIEMMTTAVRASSPRTPEVAAWANVRLALWLMQANDLPSAEATITRALSLQPDYPPALHALGRLRLAQDRPSEAIASLEQAVRADPLPEFRWTLYEALLEAAQQDAANDQKTFLLQHGAIEDRRTFALFLASHGEKPDTALRLALQELEAREDVFTLDAVAWALAAAGRYDEALDYSRRALAEGTRDARLFLHAGAIAARAGESERARDLLACAKRLQHMLLPSERRRLANEFAVIQPRISSLESEQAERRASL